MIEQHKQGWLIWIDLLNPTQEDVREILGSAKTAPDLFNDFTAPIPNSGAKISKKAIRITMDFPIVKRTDIDHPHEIKFVVTKKHLITARYEEMEALHRFKKDFEVLTTLHKTGKKATGAHLFFAMMREIYTALTSKLDYLESKLSDIEHEIFEQHEKEMVASISQVSRRLISFRQTLKSHDDVFRQAKPMFEEVFGKTLATDFEGIYVTHAILTRRTNTLFEALDELRSTNLALLTTKQNEIMKTLTIMAFITFPLTLFTSMFGMNTQTTPIVGQPGDFWIILGIMTIVTISFFSFFKYKKWM